jgi:hypothetical protein
MYLITWLFIVISYLGVDLDLGSSRSVHVPVLRERVVPVNEAWDEGPRYGGDCTGHHESAQRNMNSIG